MNTMENICPSCKESNELEAIVCEYCGAVLEDPFMDPGLETKKTQIPVVVSESTKGWSIDEAAVPENGIAVYIEGEFNPAYIDKRGEFVIGRRSEPNSELPEGLLDLSPLGGYGGGISRRHAVIRWTEHGYEILDLGSVNGTWLNHERLVP